MTAVNFLVPATGWTLLHFIWQGALLAAALKAALYALRESSANARYLAACATLLLMLAAPLTTLSHFINAAPVQPSTDGRQSGKPLANERAGGGGLIAGEQSSSFTLVGVGLLNEQDTTALQRLEGRLNRVLPYLLGTWFIGVLCMLLRLLIGLMWTSQLRRLVYPARREWQLTVDVLARRVRISRPVRLCASALVEVPTVVGWLRPLILLPTQALTGLEPEQLRALLAHELAHIRRADYLINLLQTTIESLFFYHPAVWWVSRQMRVEREHACDDLALAACNEDAMTYARALLRVEELRADARRSTLALAADGSPLLARIKRIVMQRPQRRSTLAVALSVTLLTAMAGVNLLLLKSTQAQTMSASTMRNSSPAQADAPPKPYQAMTRAEQTAFVMAEARQIARRMSGTEYDLTPAFAAEIQRSVNYYVKRIGNHQGDRLGTGDAMLVFQRGQTYAPLLMRTFKAHNVSPLVGLYLPLVESEYVNLQTPNRAGSLGMFQFLPETGARYGLKTEELMDVEKSADAAARYIADGLAQFQNDPMKEALAVLSYNRGRSKVADDLQLVVNEQNKRCSICALTAARSQLDQTFQNESVYYVPYFFAAAIIGENPQAFGLNLQPLSSYEGSR